jgi:hypothetical protein
MKKTIIMLAIAFGGTTAFAQDLTSKKGEPYLPEAGDWAISFDAAPFLTYAGNLFNGSTAVNGSPSVGYVSNMPWGIVGKMFKDEKTAYRGMLRIGMGSNTWENFVMQDGQTDPNVTVMDEKKTSGHNVLLGGGLEMRRGKTRLQGYYGGMLWIALGGSKDEWTYGNAFSTTNMAPTATDFSTNPYTVGSMAARTTENKNGSSFGFGLRGFIGAEYFVLPKISIGAEYGWGIGVMNTGDGEATTEYWDATTSAVKTLTTKTGGTKMFGLDTDISNNMFGSGSININFHF